MSVLLYWFIRFFYLIISFFFVRLIAWRREEKREKRRWWFGLIHDFGSIANDSITNNDYKNNNNNNNNNTSPPIILNHHLISGYESNEQDRPQFEGEGILSPIDGKPMLYFAKADKDYRVRIANVSTAKWGVITAIPEELYRMNYTGWIIRRELYRGYYTGRIVQGKRLSRIALQGGIRCS
jgi:hypothetical protein